MQAVKGDRATVISKRTSKIILIAFSLAFLLIFSLYIRKALTAIRISSLPQPIAVVSKGALEEQYGLRVNLVAVTAAGGLIDLRLRIIDGEKAKTLLANQANFPTLRVGKSIELQASPDIASQTIKFENGNNIFVLYPNSQNVVKPGDTVNIVFGDLQVEAIQTK